MKCPFVIIKCTKCNKLLVAYSGNFAKQKNGKWGLRSYCKPCKNKLKREYDKEHKEEKREYDKKYQKENKTYSKKYYQENRDKRLEYQKQYSLKNPDKIFNKCQKRRIREESQGSGITKEQWLEMMEFFDWKCAYSGIQLDKNNRSIDHIISLAKGGENEIWNLVPCYSNYNTSKHTNDMLTWYKQQKFYSDERLKNIYEWIKYSKEKWK